MSLFVHTLKRHRILSGSIALAALIAVGFSAYSGGTVQADAPAAQQAVPVVTQTIIGQSVHVWSEFSGKLVAVDAAIIRPEVSGRITEIRFKDGQQVKVGDVIYVIDPRPYEAAVAKAEANLASAKTNAQFAKTELERAVELVKTQAIAKRIYDERNTANNVAAANVQSAEAELSQAKLNLEYANVKAPISGRISRAEVTVGNLVQAGPSAPVLTTIVSSDAVYADFELDEKTYLQSIRAQAREGNNERDIPVQLSLRGDGEHHYEGTVHSFDNQINASSGTMRARAKFENKDGALIPGMFASVKIASNVVDGAMVVPDRAVGTDQNKKYVYVVGDDNKVSYREVTLGASVSGGRIVTEGLKEKERVVVDGVQHVRPDVVVEPKDIAAPKDVDADKIAMTQ